MSKWFTRRRVVVVLGLLAGAGAWLFSGMVYHSRDGKHWKLATVHAQSAFQIELACPAGTSPVASGTTIDNATGKYRQNTCVDFKGNLYQQLFQFILGDNFDNVRIVDASFSRGGADIGAEINLAYASCPAAGCEIEVFPKPDGSCYSYSTPIVLNVLNKYVLLAGKGGTRGGASGSVGGACLNYVPTTATVAVLMDYASTTSGSAAHGIKDLTIINNQCVATTGCGSSAIGLDSGTTNKGTYEGHFDNVTIMGFNIGYRDLNASSVDVFWLNPTIGSNLVGMQFNSPTGIFVMGGTIAGNSIAVQSSTTTSAPNLDFIGTQFFANVATIFDFNPTTGLNMGEVNCVDCHLEDSQATNALFARGNINLTMTGGIAEEDNAVGTTPQLFNTTGFKLWLQGVSFGCNNTCTAIATVNTPTRAYISGHVLSVGHFTNLVNGANSSAATVLVSNGGGANTVFPVQFEGPFQMQGIAASPAGKSGFTNIWANGLASGRLSFNPNNTGDKSFGSTLVYSAAGTEQIGLPHIVQDTATLAAGTVTVTLTGNAVFTNATSYTCTADDDTAIAATRVLQNSGSSITIQGTGTDVVRYICAGN